MSTYLHSIATSGTLPPEDPRIIPSCRSDAPKNPHYHTSLLLLSLVIPGHLVFLYTITAMGNPAPSVLFVVLYLLAGLLQVFLLLLLTRVLVYLTWSLGGDPDTTTIPYLTALGDLLGTALLFSVFLLLDAAGDSVVKEDIHNVGNSTALLNSTLVNSTTEIMSLINH